MFRNLVVAALAVMAIGVATSAEAQRAAADRWVRIGSQEVDLTKSTATIDVSKAAGTVKALRLESRRGAITMSNVEVVYAEGRAHNERRDINLLEGERTRPINQGTDERFVDRLVLSVKPVADAKRPTVLEVFALQSPKGAATPRPAAPVSGPVATTPTFGRTTADAGDVVGGGAVLFGVQRVGFANDRDVIRVGAQLGKFDKIRLRVIENDIFVNDLKVVYANGESDTLAVNAQIDRNSRTQWLPLKGDRFIQEIQFSYRSKPNFRGQAQVEVYGEFADGWLGATGEARKFNEGWVLLGKQTAGFIGFDNDLIEVARNRGGFKELRVTVRERAITLNELRVAYTRGKDEVIPVKARVDAGTTWGPVALKGEGAVKEIRAKYRSRFFDNKAVGRGGALVEIWARY